MREELVGHQSERLEYYLVPSGGPEESGWHRLDAVFRRKAVAGFSLNERYRRTRIYLHSLQSRRTTKVATWRGPGAHDGYGDRTRCGAKICASANLLSVRAKNVQANGSGYRKRD